MAPSPDCNFVEDVVGLAAEWLQLANRLLAPREKRFQNQMASLLDHTQDKVFFTEMIDQCFRSKNTARIGDQLLYLFKQNGMPAFFSATDRILFRLFLSVGKYVSGISSRTGIYSNRHGET